MKTYKPIGRRIIGFSVNQLSKRSHGLYIPNSRRDLYQNVQPFWVYEVGPECKLEVQRGDCILIQDQFELIGGDLNLWDDNQALPEFEKLNRLVAEYEGKVSSNIIFESSAIAMFDGDPISLFGTQKTYAHNVG